jgi:DNA polymerase-3 subunit epsilon
MDSTTIPANCVVFDTETTGFSVEEGDRLVEIGAVRMRDGLPTRETFHAYINPGRTVPQGAVEVHGLTTDFLRDKPMFEEIAQGFIDFVGDLPMVAHNAKFDEKFLNFQLKEIGFKTYPLSLFVDTIPIAKRKYPGQQVNLDALCRKMKISLDNRDKHGALIDSELLAEVCVELMGGRQASMFDEMTKGSSSKVQDVDLGPVETFVRYATDEERAAHAKLVEGLGPDALWNRFLQKETSQPVGDAA